MRFVLAQIGARRGYSVPAILESAGMLEFLYTDLAGNVGPGKWLVKLGPLLGFRKAAQSLAHRRIPNPIKHKTLSFGLPRFWSYKHCDRRNGNEVFRQQLRRSEALGRAMARRGFGRATHLYSMLGECSPLLAAAKRDGLTTITEFYILLSTERILKSEQKSFCDWESPMSDLDLVRREFPSEQKVIENTDFAVCPSEAVRTDLETNFGLPCDRSSVVPYGIDDRWFKLAPRPVPGRVLFVGTAGLRKGIHYLAKAAEELRSRGRHYEFRVAGEVTNRIANHPNCRFLQLLGRVPRHRIHLEFQAADLLVLPSLAEGSAEATYEALAAGIPVITTEAAGSVVRDQIEGFIIPARDATALAARIEQVVENRQLRDQMSISARVRAREYSLEKYSHRLVSALRGFGI